MYLNKGSREGLTCWIPLGDVDLRLGGLCVVGRSHCDPSFDQVRQTYSAIDVETAGIRGTGWFTEDPHEILSYGCPLLTAPFAMTDMVVFRLDTMHGSLSNGSQPGEVRISCDTRWYDANDPHGVDARYMGENPMGTATWWVNRHNKEVFPTSMEEAKIAWGLTSWLVGYCTRDGFQYVNMLILTQRSGKTCLLLWFHTLVQGWLAAGENASGSYFELRKKRSTKGCRWDGLY